MVIPEDPGLYLTLELGFKCDCRTRPASENSRMTFSYFNGCTVAIDDKGNVYSIQGYIDLSPTFDQCEVEVIPAPKRIVAMPEH